MLVYPKNYLPDKSNWSNLGQNYPTLCFMIHSLRICFEIVWRDGAQYRQKEQYGPNLAQNYTTYINCSRYF